MKKKISDRDINTLNRLKDQMLIFDSKPYYLCHFKVENGYLTEYTICGYNLLEKFLGVMNGEIALENFPIDSLPVYRSNFLKLQESLNSMDFDILKRIDAKREDKINQIFK